MIVFGILAQGQAQTGALINNVLKDKHPPPDVQDVISSRKELGGAMATLS